MNKLFLLFKKVLLVFCLLASTIYPQALTEIKLNLTSQELEFEKLISHIESLTQLKFSFEKETISMDNKLFLVNGEISLFSLLENIGKKSNITFHRTKNQIKIIKNTGDLNEYVIDDEVGCMEGYVKDSATNEPIQFASVFLSGTTIGVVTNKSGYYKLNNVPKSKYVLVASIVGYTSKSIDIDLKTKNKILTNISLEQSNYTLTQIEVIDNKNKDWEENYEHFKEIFLGYNQFADDCSITNPYIINFSKKDNILYANANSPLIIKNNALGYTIECELKSFEYNKNKSFVKTVLNTKFSEYPDTLKDSLEYFQKNRTKVYYGSLTHFLTSLIKGNTLTASGFVIIKDNSYLRELDDITAIDTSSGNFFFKYKGVLTINYNRTSSKLNLFRTYTELDPAGFFYNPDDFRVEGFMANEGLATMLPKFWHPSYEM